MKTNSATSPKYVIFFFLSLILVSAVVCWITVTAFNLSPDWSQHDQHGGHHWLHQELGLSKEQAAAIDVFEEAYRAERKKLLKEFAEEMTSLAELIRSNDSFSNEVNHKIHELHQVHGDLQRLSIEHYYQMLSVLPEDKKDALRNLAVEALSKPD
jgi:nickel and cobalt resistance protein CnrR